MTLMAHNDGIETSWEQLTLSRPDRIHVRFDCYLVPGAGTVGLTTTVWDGVQRQMVAMEARGVEVAGLELGPLARVIEEKIEAQWRRAEPF